MKTIRYRLLQARDQQGRWYGDAYAIEDAQKHVSLHYPLAWEHLGGEYNAQIRKRNIALEQLELILTSPRLRWMEIKSASTDFDHAIARLDRECGFGVPTNQSKAKLAA